MRRIGRWTTLLMAAALCVADGALAQPGSPVTASIFFINPPPNQTFGVGAPIGIAIQVRNVSGTTVDTADGFLETEFWRQLFFTTAGGGIVTNTGQTPRHASVLACWSRGGVLEPVTAIPVVPLETLPADYATQFNIDDARKFYDLSRGGRYSVNARFGLVTFDATDPTAVITNCDQFAGQKVVNVGGAAVGSNSFTVVSNSLTFCIGYCNFSGFLKPLEDDDKCAKKPCHTFKLGSTIPVKFQLLDPNGTPFGGATAKISVVQLKGSAPLTPPIDLGTGVEDTGNVFRFDAKEQQYIFNLKTKVLSVGTWRIDVTLDSGAVQSVQVGLK